jgi:hypothetical protein
MLISIGPETSPFLFRGLKIETCCDVLEPYRSSQAGILACVTYKLEVDVSQNRDPSDPVYVCIL